MANNDYFTINFTASDGSSWTRPMPEFVKRELAVFLALDALAERLTASEDVVKRARQAVASASTSMRAEQLLAGWQDNTDTLTTALEDAAIAGADVIDKIQRRLGLK